MAANDELPSRRSIRLPGYDYGGLGAYYVTICTHRRACLFGTVESDAMRLSAAGRLASQHWEALPQRFPGLTLDAYVVMPNHLHGILVFSASAGATEQACRAGPQRAATRDAPTVGDVVGAYKSIVTVEYGRMVRSGQLPAYREHLWQRNYYEHIIRDDTSLERHRRYITDNPARWALDDENPAGTTGPSVAC